MSLILSIKWTFKFSILREQFGGIGSEIPLNASTEKEQVKIL